MSVKWTTLACFCIAHNTTMLLSVVLALFGRRYTASIRVLRMPTTLHMLLWGINNEGYLVGHVSYLEGIFTYIETIVSKMSFLTSILTCAYPKQGALFTQYATINILYVHVRQTLKAIPPNLMNDFTDFQLKVFHLWGLMYRRLLAAWALFSLIID